MSERSTNIINDRGKARKDRNLSEFERLSRDFRKSRKQDRRDRVLEGLTKELDIRDRWLGIRELKTKYTPSPYHNKDAEGNHVQWKDRAQKAAEHLSTKQWGDNTHTTDPH